MAVGSNLPDLDFVYSAVTGDKLDYLLEHRGHTHTIVGAMVAAALVLSVCELWMRRRHWQASVDDRLWLIAMTLLAPLLHLAMDFTNSYGVHPFWPLDNRWYYGDSVFIVEPLFWAAIAPLAFLLRTQVARALIFAVLIGGAGLSAATHLVPAGLIVLFCALALVMLAVGRYAKPQTALAASIAVWLLTTLTFAVASHAASKLSESYATKAFPAAQTLDRILTPMPMNPLCWELILVRVQAGDYSLRRAMLSLAPAFVAAVKCPSRNMQSETAAPLTEIVDAGAPALRWYGEFIASRDELKALAKTHCEAAALLRFARAPWIAQIAGRTLLGDLRYDRGPDLGFAGVEIGKEKCPVYVPPWTPPRNDLLR